MNSKWNQTLCGRSPRWLETICKRTIPEPSEKSRSKKLTSRGEFSPFFSKTQTFVLMRILPKPIVGDIPHGPYHVYYKPTQAQELISKKNHKRPSKSLKQRQRLEGKDLIHETRGHLDWFAGKQVKTWSSLTLHSPSYRFKTRSERLSPLSNADLLSSWILG